jgi:hypothetical protein
MATPRKVMFWGVVTALLQFALAILGWGGWTRFSRILRSSRSRGSPWR